MKESIVYEVTEKGSRKVAKNIDEIGNSANRSSGTLSKFKGLLIAIGSSIAVKSLFNTISTFQSLEASLKSVTGSSERAKSAFALVRDVAGQLPSTVEEIARGFTKLTALGLNPSREALISYSNTASALGKNLNDFIEAVADAATNEFERLKEFGIKAKQQADTVSFTFQGVTTTVKKNSDEIEGYLRSIGEVQFAGAATEQMKTLSGRVSNLKDNFDNLLVTIGEAGATRTFEFLIDKISEFVSFTTVAVKQLPNVFIAFFATVEKGYITMKAGFTISVEAMKNLWINFINVSKEGFAGLLKFTAKGLDFIGATNISSKINSYSESLKQAVASTKPFSERISEIKDNLDKQKEAIDDNAVSLIMFNNIKLREKVSPLTYGDKSSNGNKFDLDALRKVSEDLETERESLIRVFAERKKIIISNTESESKIRLELLQKNKSQLDEELSKISNFDSVKKQLESENNVLKLNSSDRKAANQILEIERQLRVNLTAEQRNSILEITKENESLKSRNDILDEISDKTDNYINIVRNLKSLLDSGNISNNDATAFLVSKDVIDESIAGINFFKETYANALAEINLLRQNDLINEEQAARAKLAANNQYLQSRLSSTQQILGQLSGLASSENKKAARIGRAAAITQATIDGFLAVQKALSSAPPPVNFGLAAATTALTAQNISKIRSQPEGFRTGGEFTVGGSGGPDSQLVPIMATPGERVTVSTPNQVRKGDAQPENKNISITIVNLKDEKELENYLSSGSSDKVFINKMESNATTIKQIIAAG